MPDTSKRSEGGVSPVNLLEVDFALVVSRLIEAAKNDPAQLRSSVYELARLKLIDQAGSEDRYEQRRLLEALETAITGVEAFSQRQEHAKLGPPGPASRELTVGNAISDRASLVSRHLGQEIGESEFRPSRRSAGFASSAPDIVQVSVTPARRSFRARHVLLVTGILAVVTVGGVYLQRHQEALKPLGVIAGRWPTSSQPAQPKEAGARMAAAALDHAIGADGNSALLPKTFGIYAISADQLFELEPLPGRVPDLRVAVSAAITTPSRTSLPDGKARFIVYRRDSVNNAPDRAEIRVIAKVVSAMTFANSGKPAVVATEDTWVIRNVAIGYRVAPVKEAPDMYEIRSESDDFSLSPGRYALVIKGSAYDFTVAGKATDPNHCLERIEASNGSFYAPCQKP